VLDNCFINKRYGKDGSKPAKDLIFGPLFEDLDTTNKPGRDRTTRQSACYVLRKLNERYMDLPDVVDTAHCQYITQLGIKSKIYDGEFLMTLVDLIKHHGPTNTLGKHLTKAMPHFIASVQYNMGGTNALGKVQRDHNIMASLEILTLMAKSVIELDYSKSVNQQFGVMETLQYASLVASYFEDLQQAVEKLKGESLFKRPDNSNSKQRHSHTFTTPAQCVAAWK